MAFSKWSLGGILLGCLMIFSCGQDAPQLDVLITGGTVYDGVAAEPLNVDIGVMDGKIVFLGAVDTTSYQTKETIDATGYVVSPGFIDSHTHALNDLSDSARNANLNYLLQGVTTVMTGSDGNSENLIGERLKYWETNGIGTNAAMLVGHRNIRRTVMGVAERAPTEEELTNMKTLVRRGMEEGALGFSTGLYYTPASFSETDEVVELAKISAEYGGIYDAHIRDESTYNIGLMAAIQESIEIAERADILVNISHIKCLGVDVWGMSRAIVDTINAARDRGLQITADQYPYRASGTSVSNALLPKWVFADLDDYTKKFDDPELLPKIEAGITENIRRRGGPESLLLVLANMPGISDKTLGQVAKEWDVSPTDAAITIIKNGDSRLTSFNMSPEDIHYFMQQPWVMTCSDGTNAHPRKYGTFAKKMREYVLEEEVIALVQMINQSTALTAETFGINDRGKIKEGYAADILIFKPEEVKDNATFTDPAQLSSGFHHIILNGKIAVRDGEVQLTDAGQVIRRQ
ncbi:MAG: amidohydrolase family protein [Bacteroidota bacterium]